MVYEPTISCLTSFVLTMAECNTLDKKIFGYGRSLVNTFPDVAPHVNRMLSNDFVWRRLGLSPVATELRVRRLQWWQSISCHPTINAHIIAAHFCSLGGPHPLMRMIPLMLTMPTPGFASRPLISHILNMLMARLGLPITFLNFQKTCLMTPMERIFEGSISRVLEENA